MSEGTIASDFIPVRIFDKNGEVLPLDEVEKQVLRFVCDHYMGNMSRAAKALRMSRTTLYRKFKQHGLIIRWTTQRERKKMELRTGLPKKATGVDLEADPA